MLKRIRQCQALLQQYGLRRCLFRAGHDLRRKHGLLKRGYPVWQWQDRPLETWVRPGVFHDCADYRAYRAQSPVRFFFPPGAPPTPSAGWVEPAMREAEGLRQGTFRYFSHMEGTLGQPPDWFLNPFTGQHDSIERHWCDRGDFDPGRGDIKFIWEPSRFGWVYALVRAYAADRRPEYAETFWQLFESWLLANPPQMGPNWMCGQEIGIRCLACVFALYAFWDAPATTEERVRSMVVLLAASAERIAGNIDYARAQMGNHAVSEAAGLWTIGVLFPELRAADAWRRHGQWVLEDEVRQYNYPDGSYTQHSVNYQRLMLHDYLWCLRLAEVNGQSFSERVRDRLDRSCEFLYQLQDAATGRLPNYGPNDGALILPLNGCDYLDYRPVIGAMHYQLRRERLYEDGPWSEDLLWLYGPEARGAPERVLPRSSREFLDGGYFVLRGEQSWGMVRCHSYRNRPNQADMLHLDLWWRGINLLRDAGSCTYYDPDGGWNRHFVSTAVHNTVEVRGLDQMVKGARFQWYSLLKSRFLGWERTADTEIWTGEHYGYARLPSKAVHRRSICRVGEQHWLVVDDVFGVGAEEARLCWHLPDVPCRRESDGLILETPEGPCSMHVISTDERDRVELLRAVDEPGQRAGWESLYYGERRPVLAVHSSVAAQLPFRWVTLITLGATARLTCRDPLSYISWVSVDLHISAKAVLNPPDRNRGALAGVQVENSCASAS